MVDIVSLAIDRIIEQIPVTMLIGIGLMILGIVIATFVPLIGRKLGLIMFLVGFIMSIGLRIFLNIWENTTARWIIVMTGTVILAFIIIFAPERK